MGGAKSKQAKKPTKYNVPPQFQAQQQKAPSADEPFRRDEELISVTLGDRIGLSFWGPHMVYQYDGFNEPLKGTPTQALKGATQLTLFLTDLDDIAPFLPLRKTIPTTLENFTIKVNTSLEEFSNELADDLIVTLRQFPHLRTFNMAYMETLPEDILIRIEDLCEDPEAWSHNCDKWKLRTGEPVLPATHPRNRLILREHVGIAKTLLDRLSAEFDDNHKDPKWKEAMMQSLAIAAQPLKSLVRSRARHTFVIRVEDIAKLRYWPKHEEAVEKDLLMHIFITWHDIEWSTREVNRFKAIGGNKHPGRLTDQVLFVSHKWQETRPDTEAFDILHKVLEYCETVNTNIHYLWFDYSCVPQQDKQLQFRHLLSIPKVLTITSCVSFHASEQLQRSYMLSVWCLLEALLLPKPPPVPDPSQLTIFDWKDLYAVLPGFLLIFGSKGIPRQSLFKDGGKERAQILGGILSRFIDFHDASPQ